MYSAHIGSGSVGVTARDRQRIATPWLYVLLGLGVLPLLLMGLRFLALSGAGPVEAMAPGTFLNQHLSLQWVGFEDRDVVLYILLLPLAALLIALTRLTLGIRVLGFRSILIAIGMLEIGVVPCLLLIGLIAVTVILIRPSMRRSGMPLFARVAVVLCVVAFTMLGGLLMGAWLESATLWSMAFFPVVILAMLAESVAATVARDGLAMGLWRTATTIALAGIIAGLYQITPLRELVLFCPELLLTPLVLIVLVSEFLDLRLFEDFRPFAQDKQVRSSKPQIALVRNRFPEASPRRLPTELPKRYRQASLQAVIDQLRAREYDVQVLECDCTLPERLRALSKVAFGPKGRGLCVLNYSGGVQGTGRMTQVPALCEMLGIPHTGPVSEAPALSSDRLLQQNYLRAQGIAVPTSISLEEAKTHLQGEGSPLWVRPRFQSDRGAVRVHNPKQLASAIKRVERRFGSALVEVVPAGLALTAIVQSSHNGENAHVLPLLERTSGRNPFSKPVDLPESLRQAVADLARRAAQTLSARDTTRIDLYCSDSGTVCLSRIVPIEPLSERSGAGIAASLAGISLGDLAEASIRCALRRADADPAPRTTSSSTEAHIQSHIIPIRSTSPCNTSVSSATA